MPLVPFLSCVDAHRHPSKRRRGKPQSHGDTEAKFASDVDSQGNPFCLYSLQRTCDSFDRHRAIKATSVPSVSLWLPPYSALPDAHSRGSFRETNQPPVAPTSQCSSKSATS